MKQITYFTNNANQKVVVTLDDGSSINFSLKYFENQLGWFYTLSYGNFIRNSRRLVSSPNLLRAYRNILPFGLACIAVDGYEPTFLDDFSSGRVCVYILNAQDIIDVENDILFKEFSK